MGGSRPTSSPCGPVISRKIGRSLDTIPTSWYAYPNEKSRHAGNRPGKPAPERIAPPVPRRGRPPDPGPGLRGRHHRRPLPRRRPDQGQLLPPFQGEGRPGAGGGRPFRRRGRRAVRPGPLPRARATRATACWAMSISAAPSCRAACRSSPACWAPWCRRPTRRTPHCARPVTRTSARTPPSSRSDLEAARALYAPRSRLDRREPGPVHPGRAAGRVRPGEGQGRARGGRRLPVPSPSLPRTVVRFPRNATTTREWMIMTTNAKPFVWYELTTTDTAAAQAFYRQGLRLGGARPGLPGMQYRCCRPLPSSSAACCRSPTPAATRPRRRSGSATSVPTMSTRTRRA